MSISATLEAEAGRLLEYKTSLDNRKILSQKYVVFF